MVLEFDHQKDKEFDVCGKIGGKKSFEAVKQEIEKCEVRCANCHVRRHSIENKSYRYWTDIDIEEAKLHIDKYSKPNNLGVQVTQAPYPKS